MKTGWYIYKGIYVFVDDVCPPMKLAGMSTDSRWPGKLIPTWKRVPERRIKRYLQRAKYISADRYSGVDWKIYNWKFGTKVANRVVDFWVKNKPEQLELFA